MKIFLSPAELSSTISMEGHAFRTIEATGREHIGARAATRFSTCNVDLMSSCHHRDLEEGSTLPRKAKRRP